MVEWMEQLHVEVPCPTCTKRYEVSMDSIRASQRLLATKGPCDGFAAYECPAPYLAGLVAPEVVEALSQAFLGLERDLRTRDARAVVRGGHSSSEPPSPGP